MKLVFPGLLAATFLPISLGWGQEGHEIVATVAQIYLQPEALTAVCSLLGSGPSRAKPKKPKAGPPCFLADVSTWADQVRFQPQFRYTAPLHYVGAVDDDPADACAFPGRSGWEGKKDMNVLGAVRNNTDILLEWQSGEGGDATTAANALKFLVHYLGDMHQPLHLTNKGRGGNDYKVRYDGKTVNLHALWDSTILEQEISRVPSNYSRPFPPGSTFVDVEPHLRGEKYDSYVRRLMYEGVGAGGIAGRFDADIGTWLACPKPPVDSEPSQPEPEEFGSWEALQSVVGAGGRRRPRVMGDESRWDDASLCPFAWAQEPHQLNCDIVWSFESRAHAGGCGGAGKAKAWRPYVAAYPELDTPEYGQVVRDDWVIEKMLAMAGVRLAGVLNGIFAASQA